MDFRETRVCKSLSAVILFFFVWTFAGGYDIALAAKTGDLLSPPTAAPGPKEPSPAAKLNAAMAQAEAVLADTSLTMKEKQSRLKDIKVAIKAIDAEMRAGFEKTEQHLKDRKLPGEIMSRHQKFVRHYESNFGQLMKDLNDLERAKKQAEFDRHAGRALGHLKEAKPKKRHQPLDPNKLPHRSAEPTDMKPRLNKEEFIDELRAQGEPVLLASAGSIAGLLDANTDYQMLALASGAPTDADLAETIEVQFTEAIVAKAAELNNDPLTIYEWVRNNVEFAPTWGSIQGADYCLQTMECNAMDTASLLIALLRASGVHARYAHGTIEMPIEKAKNWLGGFTDSYAALKFSQSGGIPSKGLVDGGAIKYAQFEHVWVEAWIDYFPSRGAKHQSGQGDTWIPLDGSFKQYDKASGLNVFENIPLDIEGIYESLQSSAEIDAETGSITGVDSSVAEQIITNNLDQVNGYLTDNYPYAYTEIVFGETIVKDEEFPYLLGTLPYRLKIIGARYHALPSNLQHKIFVSIENKNNLIGDVATYVVTLPEVSGKRISLGYKPASLADIDIIQSLFLEPNSDGTPLEFHQMPQSFPAYLIQMKPVLWVDGEIMMNGGSIGMGQSQSMRITFDRPNAGPVAIKNEIVTGEFYGIYIDTGYKDYDDFIERTADDIVYMESTLAGEIIPDSDDIFGRLCHTILSAYFSQLSIFEDGTGQVSEITSVHLPSLGFAHSILDMDYVFGTPVSAAPSGMMMDIDYQISAVGALDGDKEKEINFNLISGTYGSILEHAVPEQLFQGIEETAEAFSAVKLLGMANEQNIPIYTITKENVSSLLPLIQASSDIVSDIQNVVTSGLEVTISGTSLSLDGWDGTGYIVYDPLTGNGGYMISGGYSGAFTMTLASYWMQIGAQALEAWPDDPLFGLEIIQSAVNLIITAQTLWMDVLKHAAGTAAELAMNFMPFDKVFKSVHIAAAPLMAMATKAQRLKKLRKGISFEAKVLENLGFGGKKSLFRVLYEKGGKLVKGGTIPDHTIRDALDPNKIKELWEIKRWKNLDVGSGNISKLLALAKKNDAPLNLVVNRGTRVSESLTKAVCETGGLIYRYNHQTGTYFDTGKDICP